MCTTYIHNNFFADKRPVYLKISSETSTVETFVSSLTNAQAKSKNTIMTVVLASGTGELEDKIVLWRVDFFVTFANLGLYVITHVCIIFHHYNI